eukprot:gene47023-12495_t
MPGMGGMDMEAMMAAMGGGDGMDDTLRPGQAQAVCPSFCGGAKVEELADADGTEAPRP